MAVIRVDASGVSDLASDLRTIAVTTKPKLAKVVSSNVNQGTRVMQGIAKKKAGPHGRNYWKRISGEVLSPLEGEWGPTGDVVGNAVGAGWRNGPPNTDAQQSADIQGPQFAKDVRDLADGLFWPS